MKKLYCLVILIVALSGAAEESSVASNTGFVSVVVTVNARVNGSLQEAQRVNFGNQLVIDPQAGGDIIFMPTSDQIMKGTSGTVYKIKVSSVNGTAVNQACTANGVSGMKLRSANSPGDTIPYTFMCAGDTEGTGQFRGAGFNTPRALGIGIKVAGADAEAAMAHTDYSDTITLMISY
jgi:hypothetical protein